MNKTQNPESFVAKKKIDWGREFVHFIGLAAKVVLRICTYLLNIVLTLLLIVFLTGIIAGSAFAIYIKNYVDPTIDEALFDIGTASQTTRLYYYDYEDRANRIGEAVELEDERLYGENNSIWASLSDIRKNHTYLEEAFIAIEDKRFIDHSGVDWVRSIKACLNFFLGFDDTTGGGSTLTQQLIKNTTGNDDVTIQRKVQEILSALELEKVKTKDEILELYLNIVPLSQGCTGVQTAAHTYFSKDVSELTLIECACIASITNAPTRYDPVRNPENNAYRRNLILDFMLEYGYISLSEYEEAYTDITVTRDEEGDILDIVVNEEKLVLNYSDRNSTAISTNSWYTDTVINDVIDDLVEEKGYTRVIASNLIYSGGLQIYTLMDPFVQDTLDDIWTDESNFPENVSGVAAEAAMCIVDPYTGDLLGIAGARGEKTANRILNYADDTTRPPGSSIKPLAVYGPAIETGLITVASVYDDTPVNFGTNKNNPVAWPLNLPVIYEGLMNAKYALATSKNTVTIKILQDLGIETAFSYVKDKFAIKSAVDVGYYNDGTTYTDKGLAAMGLGQLSNGASVRDMVTAYTVWPNMGVVSRSRSYDKVCDADGNVILDNKYEAEVVFKETTAFLITTILEDVVDWGTSYKIDLRNYVDVAGKTGTSNDDQDRWFMGFTPYYVGGCWYGYATPKSMTNLVYYNPSQRLWDITMTRLHQPIFEAVKNGEEELREFERPDGIVEVLYCKDSGLLSSEACTKDPRGVRAEWGYFVEGTEPTTYCTTHVMVEYDAVTGGIACDKCPRENVIKVALLKIEGRNFPIEVVVSDAQYTYRDLPYGVRPSGSTFRPFYANVLSEDYPFCGTTNYYGAKQYNSMCTVHFDYGAYDDGKYDFAGIYAVVPSSVDGLLPKIEPHDDEDEE